MSLIFAHDDWQTRDLTLRSQIPAKQGGWVAGMIAKDCWVSSLVNVGKSMAEIKAMATWARQRNWAFRAEACSHRTQKKYFPPHSTAMKRNIEKKTMLQGLSSRKGAHHGLLWHPIYTGLFFLSCLLDGYSVNRANSLQSSLKLACCQVVQVAGASSYTSLQGSWKALVQMQCPIHWKSGIFQPGVTNYLKLIILDSNK
jgi:hypothetical protein